MVTMLDNISEYSDISTSSDGNPSSLLTNIFHLRLENTPERLDSVKDLVNMIPLQVNK